MNGSRTHRGSHKRPTNGFEDRRAHRDSTIPTVKHKLNQPLTSSVYTLHLTICLHYSCLTTLQGTSRIARGAEVAQLVEQRPEKAWVPSSSLGLGTSKTYNLYCGRSSAVERLLAKEKVVGSNPIARSRKVLYRKVLLRRRGQVVRQGPAKPLFAGSNPAVASVTLQKLIHHAQYLY